MADARLSKSLSNGNGSAPMKLRPEPHSGKWVATLSDGTTVVEDSGDWTIKAGEPTPWVRLAYFLGENDLHLTSLRLNFEGRTIHLPRPNFDKFGYNGDLVKEPVYYSLSYHVEAEMDLGGGQVDQTLFMDLAAHYDEFAVHYVQDVTEGNNGWVIVTSGHQPLAATPRRAE